MQRLLLLLGSFWHVAPSATTESHLAKGGQAVAAANALTESAEHKSGRRRQHDAHSASAGKHLSKRAREVKAAGALAESSKHRLKRRRHAARSASAGKHLSKSRREVMAAGALIEPPKHRSSRRRAPMHSAKRSLFRREDDEDLANLTTFNSERADDDLGVLTKACEHPGYSADGKWQTMSSVTKVLNELQAPYMIHCGLLLGLVRSCSIFDSDLDFVIEHDWMRDNLDVLEEKLETAGFKPGDSFGVPRETGLEQAVWSTTSKVKVDLFTYKRSADGYAWGLWVNGEFHRCNIKSHGQATFDWDGVQVQVPVPVESALTSLYGAKYMQRRPWTWNKEPFTIGSCEREPSGVL